MSVDEFQEVFSQFLTHLRPYSARQRSDILKSTKSLLVDILASAPAPESETSALEVEIADSVFPQGGRSVFQRYDHAQTGSISFEQLTQALSSVGVRANESDLTDLLDQFDLMGNGRFWYDEFLKSLKAKGLPRHAPKAVTKTEDLSDGVAKMLEKVAAKNPNLKQLYKLLIEKEKSLSLEKFAEAFPSLGFPESSTATQEDIVAYLSPFGKKNAGFLSLSEFLAFFDSAAGNSQPQEQQQPALNLDSTNITQVFAKVSNQNLRKVFKEFDQDVDGVISVEELCQGLVSYGLARPAAKHPTFLELASSFCKRKPGKMSYAEFVKFMSYRVGQSNRTAGQPVFGVEPIKIPEDATLSQVTSLIHNSTREVSLESYFSQHDPEDVGLISKDKFSEALTQLGVEMSADQTNQLFSAFDHFNNGTIKYEEFCRAMVNPNRNSKLGMSIRQNPGGESSVPLGSYADDGASKVEVRRSAVKSIAPPGGADNVSLSSPPPSTPVTKKGSNKKSSKKKKHQSTASKVKLSMEPADDDEEHEPAPRSSIKTMGGQKSAVMIATDTTPVAPRDPASIRETAGGGKTNWSLQFDAEGGSDEKAHSHKPIGGQDSVDLTDNLATLTRAPSLTVPPGGVSTISMKQTDKHQHRPARVILARPGGNSSIDLTNTGVGGTGVTGSPATQPRHTHTPSRSTVDLSFDPQAAVSTALTGKALKSLMQSPGGHTSINLSHSEVKSKPKAQISTDLVDDITRNTYKRGRVRAVFNSLNESDKTVSLVSMHDFENGIKGWGVDITADDAALIYEKYDKDADGLLSYAEFVRLLNSSSVAAPSATQ